MADGLTLDQLSGVWITGAVTNEPGVTLNQLSGIWITGSPVTETAGAVSWMKLAGIWVNDSVGGTASGESRLRAYDQRVDLTEFDKYLKKILLIIVTAINDQL